MAELTPLQQLMLLDTDDAASAAGAPEAGLRADPRTGRRLLRFETLQETRAWLAAHGKGA